MRQHRLFNVTFKRNFLYRPLMALTVRPLEPRPPRENFGIKFEIGQSQVEI